MPGLAEDAEKMVESASNSAALISTPCSRRIDGRTDQSSGGKDCVDRKPPD
jgi:hypothetical protein